MITGLTSFHFLLAGLPGQAGLILSLVLFIALAMIVHELGHLVAARICKVSASEIGLGLGPKLFGVQIGSIGFSLRALPLASFLRLDGTTLEARPLGQRLFVHLGGIIFNLLAGFVMYGTIFGWISLMLAAANLLPLYKHDGWKCGVVVMRALLRKKSQPAEWVFTFSGGFVSLVVIYALIQLFK